MTTKNPDGYLLGIDAGTTVTKSAVFDFKGNEIAVATCPTLVRQPEPASSEADMAEIWQAVCRTISELVSNHGIDPDAIKAIGICSTMGGLWLLDKNKRPFRQSVLWNDGRAAAILGRWEKSGIMDEIFGITGNVILPGMTMAALKWMQEKEPDNLKRTKYLCCSKDWIRFKLTGEICTDETDLSQMPGDIRNRQYSSTLFRLCEIEEHQHLFPEIRPSHEIVGRVHAEAAAQTGLKKGIPVVTGLTDVAAAVIGAGAVTAGSACSIIGTSALNNIVLEQPSFEPPGIGFQFLMPEKKWIRSFANTSGTINLDWFLEQFGDRERLDAEKRGISIYQVVEEAVSSIPIGSGGVIFHPYLNTTGVGAPFRNAGARAQFFGISADHDKRHLLRAIYEGLGMAVYELYRLSPTDISRVTLTGGVARSPFWCQLLSDITGLTMAIPKGSEFGAKGVAALAGIGIGVYNGLDDATRQTGGIQREYVPDLKKHEQYKSLYQLYRKIYTTMQDHWWDRLNLLEKFES